MTTETAVPTSPVPPRTCGHAFILTGTCKECRRWVADVKAHPLTKTASSNASHGAGH